MENRKKIQIGLLAVAAALLVATLFGGGLQNFFGKTEGNKIREAAAAEAVNGTQPNPYATPTNIPGTNVNETPTPTGPTTTIKYEEETYDFGTCNEGDRVAHAFKFKNTGSEPLLITNAKGSCGCTVPTWPKEPIPPGGTGELKVEFNSAGKPGNQSKRVTVTANTVPTETFVEIKGVVKGKEQPAAKGH